MATHAAFLRAVNLGKNRRVSGSELSSVFEGMGFGEVASFRTSGNVAFAAAEEAGLRERIEAALADALGYEVPVFLRSAEELRAMAAREPFDGEAVASSGGKLQVMLLEAEPERRVRDEVLALGSDDDRLAFDGRELYWLPSGGTQGSALDLKRIEQLLGHTTMRTHGTIEAMAAKFFAA